MDTQKGLSESEVTARRKKYGSNRIAKGHSFSTTRLLIGQFSSPLMLVLIAAGTVSYFMHGVTDAIVVYLAVFLNGFLGFFQEHRAEKALQALERQIEADADVLRDSRRIRISVDELVVDDIVYLKAGDKIPADGIVLRAESLTVSEAILTGESVPVLKEASVSQTTDTAGKQSTLYRGTVITRGLAVMRVNGVGMNTEMGKIAGSLANEKRSATPLQMKMSHFSRILTLIIITLAIFLFAVGMLRGLPAQEIFLVAAAMAVSAIPEGLAVALTVILVLGMQRLLARRALVRKLLAAETLGSVTVLCSDKTGTLTKGEMHVVGSEGVEPHLAELAQLCNDLSDPIEEAMKVWGENVCRVSSAGCRIEEWKRAATIPFDPSRTYGATYHTYQKHGKIIVRGAPEAILRLSAMNARERRDHELNIEKLARKGYRLVALAEKLGKHSPSEIAPTVDAGGFRWAGLIVMEDPVRAHVEAEIAKLVPAGIAFKVVTGDYAATAAYVMSQLGISTEKVTITGEEYRKLRDESRRATALRCVLFARFSPEDKLTLVKDLQNHGHVVAMMGDGVNDAPALKRANIGIVVSTASDVSKETADMILLDDQLGTVIAGIEEGRGIFERIKKVVQYLLSDSFSEVVLISVALFIGLPLPVTAAQILWVNLANDTFPALALSLDPVAEDAMHRKPVSASQGIVDRSTKLLILMVSAVSGLMVLGYFALYLRLGYSLVHAQSIAFFLLGINTLLTVFVIRRMDTPLWRIRFFDNLWLLGGVCVGILMQTAAIFAPPLQKFFGTQALAATEIAAVALGSLGMVFLIELLKTAVKRRNA